MAERHSPIIIYQILDFRYYPEMVQDEKLRCEKFYMGLRGRIWDFVPSWHDYVDLVQIAFRMEMSRNICIEDKEYEQDRKRGRTEQ